MLTFCFSGVVARVQGFVGIYFQLCLEYRIWIFLEAQKRTEQKKNTPILVFADVIGCIGRNLKCHEEKHCEFFKRCLSRVVGLEVNVEKNKWLCYYRDS